MKESRHRRPRRRDDRGTVLVLATMVLLVLSAIAFVAVQSTVNQMARVGSFRVSTVAHNVTASGSEATMAVAAANPSAFNQFLAAHGFAVTMADVSSGFFDMSESGSFGREAATMSTANWASLLTDPVTTQHAPGFEVGPFCFRKYTAMTDGFYRHDVPDTLPDRQDELLRVIERNAQKRFVATLFVGPVDCN